MKAKFANYFFNRSLIFFLLFTLNLHGTKRDQITHELEFSEKEEIVETKHQLEINGEILAYRAIAGTMILKDDKDQPKAKIFYVSYIKEGVSNLKERPITFCFNGGPGSSSVWLHLGLLGPKRVNLDHNGEAQSPCDLIDNEYTSLDSTDLVFIDPVSTGFSHAIPREDEKLYHGVEEDNKSIAEFIRLYLSRFQRWESPKFIVGESYGTIRATGVADLLQDKYYICLNGIVLISTVLNCQCVNFHSGNDTAYPLILPTYTATAWYHKKLSPTLQANFYEAINQSKKFASDEYTVALFKGNLLTTSEKKKIIERLSELTGLSAEYINRSNLRVDIWRFNKELLRDQNQTVGRFDSRLKGIESSATKEYMESDPSLSAVAGAFTSAFNQYLLQDLKWKDENQYKILSSVQPWNYGCNNQYLNVTKSLRDVILKNPCLRVFVANGYYDLATPFFATEYTFNHLELPQELLDQVSMKYYDAGHMMFTYRPALIQLKNDLKDFYKNSILTIRSTPTTLLLKSFSH